MQTKNLGIETDRVQELIGCSVHRVVTYMPDIPRCIFDREKNYDIQIIRRRLRPCYFEHIFYRCRSGTRRDRADLLRIDTLPPEANASAFTERFTGQIYST